MLYTKNMYSYINIMYLNFKSKKCNPNNYLNSLTQTRQEKTTKIK